MYQLEEKMWFYLLALIPIMLVIFLFVQIWKSSKQKRFADKTLFSRLVPDKSKFKPLLKLIVLLLAFISLTIALVNPKIGTKLETIKREGVDIVFAVDVSKSMLAEDIAPNRMEKSKRLVSEIISQLASDRVGIIAYAGTAFPQLPITTDFASAKMFLQGMNTNMLSSQGTAIDEAIKLAKSYYDDEEQTNRVLFIISDGEDHSENSASIAEEAKSEGIKIFTIGVGTSKGGPIPIKRNGIIQTYKKNQAGEVVITRLDEKTLQDIANEASGTYINGNNTQEVVDFVKDTLDEMDRTEFEAKEVSDYKDQFQWFLGIGIFLIFVDVFLLERKTNWLRKLNLFNEA
ncbi:VWA domain-containing protein [Spongiivirga citrea]|uniref:VWA domain-containing protein n=1 Tax=Spongiivirga citrea TaxID=1481457 RepID=A0A6M0CN10_9FLAO|nr:VWA domain-containing protein [Spongiivirga citrea]NER17249.1 VWA domain-containing protein [Spongiivirga citrea]